MTRFTCSMSLTMGASRVAALGDGVAVDDMMANMGSAADYKANRLHAGRSPAVRLMAPSIFALPASAHGRWGYAVAIAVTPG
ncbi:MAG TPA: hypothetical protein VIH96_07070 [Paraburkholderia sp.]